MANKRVKAWAKGWAVYDFSGKLLSNGIGQGIYTIYSKRPKRYAGLVPVIICISVDTPKPKSGRKKR